MQDDRSKPFLRQPFPPRHWAEGVRERRARINEHSRRCSRLAPLAPGEDAALVAAFLAAGRDVTRCPPAFLLPVAGAEAIQRGDSTLPA